MILKELTHYRGEEGRVLDEDYLKVLAGIFWQWYALNTNRKLTKIRIWFIRRTLYVRDLYDVFVLLFGKPSVT
jgi:hypothetical protein